MPFYTDHGILQAFSFVATVERHLHFSEHIGIFLVHSRGYPGMAATRCVLKVMRDSNQPDAAVKARYLAEYTIPYTWRHANCISIFAAHGFNQIRMSDSTLHPHYWYTMEVCLGNLEQVWLDTHLSLEVRVELIEQLLNAVSYLHSAQVVHRDIKLHNLLVKANPEHVIKLADFTLAIDLEAPRPVGFNVADGTLPYLAPECKQPTEAEPDLRRVDQFATGIAIYELLSYRRLPTSATHKSGSVFQSLVIPEFSTRSTDRMPRDFPSVEQVLRRMTNADPEQRYSSISESKRALQAALVKDWLPLWTSAKGQVRISGPIPPARTGSSDDQA